MQIQIINTTMDQLTKEKLNNLEKSQDKVLQKIDEFKKEIIEFEKSLNSKDSKISLLQSKIKDLKEDVDIFCAKVQNFEVKIESIHIRTASTESKWSNIIEFFVKIFWVIMVSYLLYKLGIQGPPA